MTDVKPFSRDESLPPDKRTVAVLLVLSGLKAAHEVPGPLERFGGTCLFDIALRCMDNVSEAAERAVWADDTALLEHFERQSHPGIRLLAAPPERSLHRGMPDALHSNSVAVLDGRHPFLRPNTIDEAIRLLRIRPDIEALVACKRTAGSVYDLTGDPLLPNRNEKDATLTACGAFSVVPAEFIALGVAPKTHPTAFEIANSEAFRVTTPFARDLADAYLARQALSNSG